MDFIAEPDQVDPVWVPLHPVTESIALTKSPSHVIVTQFMPNRDYIWEKLQLLIVDTPDWCWFDAYLLRTPAVELLGTVHCRIQHASMLAWLLVTDAGLPLLPLLWLCSCALNVSQFIEWHNLWVHHVFWGRIPGRTSGGCLQMIWSHITEPPLLASASLSVA